MAGYYPGVYTNYEQTVCALILLVLVRMDQAVMSENASVTCVLLSH